MLAEGASESATRTFGSRSTAPLRCQPSDTNLIGTRKDCGVLSRASVVPLVPSRRVFLLGSKALNTPQFFQCYGILLSQFLHQPGSIT